MLKRVISKPLYATATLIFACTLPAFAGSVVDKVNNNDKNFKGVWVHKVRTAGQSIDGVMSRVNIEVKGKKFHMRDENGGEQELVFDGARLVHLLPSKKQARWYDVTEFGDSEERPFWKMAAGIEPLITPEGAGEELIAGRVCKIIKTTSAYNRGVISVTYWVDKERDVLLKKEYLLFTKKKILVREVYESEQVEFDPSFTDNNFKTSTPADWVSSRGGKPRFNLLKTKF